MRMSLLSPTVMHRVPSFVVLWAALLAGLAGAAPAGAGTVGVHLASIHVPQREFNNTNPGLYYRSDDGWTVGTYRNSTRRTSAYAGYTWEWGRLALTAGGMTGYARQVQPMLVPSVTVFTLHGATARVAFVPRVEKRIGSHVFHLMVEF